MNRNKKEIFGVVNRNDRNFWTRIGTAFENQRDGSWNLLFDYVPVNAATTIQLRDPKPSEDGGDKPAQQDGTNDASTDA
jgi:hypothetical protein